MLARAIQHAKQPLNRTFTNSARRLAGDHHGPHLMFEPKPFSKKLIGAWVWGIVGGGVVITLGMCKFQNYKGGFPQKKE